MKNDALKKHHFWLLLGFVPLFTLIGVLVVDSSVGGAITKRKQEIDAASSDIGKKQNPKPKSLLTDAEVLLTKVDRKQVDLWKDNWERQKHLYTWPSNSPLLKEIQQRDLKFGDPLPNDRGEFEEFRKPEVYRHEFSSLKKDGTGTGTGMADKVAPTQFNGGWEKVLRFANDFGTGNISKDQVWLMMEDIWVQRSLLDAVRSVNAEMAAFHRATVNKGEIVDDPTYDENGNKLSQGKDKEGKPAVVAVPTPENEKRKALFRSRTWAVELELVKDGSKQRLTGTLTNLSERLQLLGTGNMMTLRVWFKHNDPSEQPMDFRIGGEFLPGKGATKRDATGRDVPANVLPILPLDEHLLPVNRNATEIVRVEQVFDVRTVPVKRIDALVLGKTDSRLGDGAVLRAHRTMESPTPAADPNAGGAPPGGAPGGMPPMGMGPPALGGAGVGGAPPQPGGAGGAGGGNQNTKGQDRGGGPLAAVIEGNKRRYLPDGVTDQVRRMPVGIVVVVDQAYLQDTLLAFANSPLRFQITQVTWKRFRANDLSGIGPSGSSGGPGGDIDYGRGNNNITGSGDPDSFRPKPGGPPGGIPPGGPPPGLGGPPPGGPGRPPSPGGPGPMGSSGDFGSSGSSSIASESQITSGLVELSIYGVVSLYEKYVETPTAAPGTPPAGPPAGPPPGGAPGMPPAGTPGMPPKMRRRIRK